MEFSRGTIVKSFFWKLFERVSTQLIQFIVTIVLARLLLPSEYGIIALITIFIALCDVIIEGGLNTALIQKKDTDDIDYSTIFYMSVGMAVLLYVLMFLLAPVISSFYEQPKLVPVIRVLSLSLPFYAINSIQRAFVSKKMLFRQLFYSSFDSIILSGGIGIFMAYCGYGVWALVAQTITNQVFLVLIMWFTVRWRPILSFSLIRFKELFSFGWKIFCTNFIITLFVRIRTLIIGKLYSPAILAYYEKGEQFPGLIMNNVCGSIQTVIFPAFSEVQDDSTKVRAMMRRAINISCLFMFPMMICLMVAAKPLVLLLLTEKWIDVVPYMQILCIANFFRPITIPNQQAITALGHSGITLKLEIIKKIVDITILVVSCSFGAIAIAWGVVLFNFACIFINLAPNVRLLDYKIHDQIIDILPTFLISVFMGFAIVWVPFMPWSPILQLTIIAIVGVMTFTLLCRVFKIEGFMYLLGLLNERMSNYKKV